MIFECFVTAIVVTMQFTASFIGVRNHASRLLQGLGVPFTHSFRIGLKGFSTTSNRLIQSAHVNKNTFSHSCHDLCTNPDSNLGFIESSQYLRSLDDFFSDQEVLRFVRLSLSKSEIQDLHIMFHLEDDCRNSRSKNPRNPKLVKVLGNLPRRTDLLKLTEKRLSDIREDILKTTQNLLDREAAVVKMRFGLVDGKSWTLQKIGQHLNITRERVRQIESKALKHVPEMVHLKKTYLGQYNLVSTLKRTQKNTSTGWGGKLELESLHLMSHMSGLTLTYCDGIRRVFTCAGPSGSSSAIVGAVRASRLESKGGQVKANICLADIKKFLQNVGCFIYLIYVCDEPVAVYFMTPSDLGDFEDALAKRNISDDFFFRPHPFAAFRQRGSVSAIMERYRFPYGMEFISAVLVPFITTGEAVTRTRTGLGIEISP